MDNLSGDSNAEARQPSEETKTELARKGRLVSECMLSNSMFTIGGVAIGTFLGLRKKHLRPFVYAITFGTFADLLYGYTGNCRALIDDYNRAMKPYKKMPSRAVLVQQEQPQKDQETK